MKKGISKNLEEANIIYEKLYSSNTSKKNKIILSQQYFSLLKRSAYSGNVEGMYLLGIFYQFYEEEQVALNVKNFKNRTLYHKRAFYWLEKACKQDHPYACHNIAGFYSSGEIVEKDEKTEIELYLKAYKLGLNESGYALAILYKQKFDFATSILWLNKVIEMQPDDGEALFELAKYYYEGKGIKKSYKNAYELFVKSISTNNVTVYTKEEACFYIGKMYYYGQFLEQSVPKAKYLIERANIDSDHPEITAFLNDHKNIFKGIKKKIVEFG